MHDWAVRRLFTIWILSACVFIARAESTGAPPDGFPERFSQLAEMLNSEDLSPLEMAQATLLASQIFGAGTQAMPYVQSRFISAKSQGVAGLGGTFLVCHGGEKERALIRKQTETDATKRKLIWNFVSSEQRFFSSIDQGSQWQAATAILPSASKCRMLATLCMDSSDLLTRRAGMYWGYWVADAAYWKKVQAVAQADPDAATKHIASRLVGAHTKKGN